MDFCSHLQDNIATKDLQYVSHIRILPREHIFMHTIPRVEGILLAPRSTAQIAKALHNNCALLHLS